MVKLVHGEILMELFKSVVKKAFEINAYRVRIYEGDLIEFFILNKESVSTSVSVESNTTEEIFKLYGEKATANELKHMQWQVFTGPTSSFDIYYQQELKQMDLFFGENSATEVTKLKKSLRPSPITSDKTTAIEEAPQLDKIADAPNLEKSVDVPPTDSSLMSEAVNKTVETTPQSIQASEISADIPISSSTPQTIDTSTEKTVETTEIKPEESEEVDFGALLEEEPEIIEEVLEAKTEIPTSKEESEEINFDPLSDNMFDMGEETEDQVESSAVELEASHDQEEPVVTNEEVKDIAIDFSSPAASIEPNLKIVEQSKNNSTDTNPMDESISIHDTIEDEKKQSFQKNNDDPDAVEHIEISWTNEEKGSKPISIGDNALDPLLKVMMDKGASDIHLTMGETPCLRIDGDIVRYNEHPAMTPEIVEKYFYPIMPQSNRIEFARDSDTDFAYEVKGLARFRVNIFRDRTGVGAVMRQIPSEVLTAEQLGLTQNITQFAHMHKGLVVVTGPTGSGKSTTLAAIVDLVNKTRSDHILTVEDPVEFVHQQQKCLVNHREVGRHTKSFSRALRAALREDPDIVLIGEMRDLETVAIAIETAETGHLVFGTLHTNTAISTVDRIIDQFPAEQQQQIRMMLSNSLMGVIAQTLLKKKGGGRCAAHEVLVVNDAVRSMIREGKTHMLGNHMQTKKKEGNILLNDSLLKLVLDGVVDADHALGKAINRNDLIQKYDQKGIQYKQEDTAA